MKQQISKFLSRFTSFINSERGIASVAAFSTGTALTAATALVAHGHKKLADQSFDVAMQLAPQVTSALNDITSSQILDIAQVNAAAAATAMLIAAAAVVLKKPAEIMSRTFGENSVIGVNSKAKELANKGRNEEARQYVTEALQRTHHGKYYLVEQYLQMEKNNPSAVHDIKQALGFNKQNNAELTQHQTFART